MRRLLVLVMCSACHGQPAAVGDAAGGIDSPNIADGGADGPGSAGQPLALGDVTSVTPGTSCGPGAATNAECSTVTVHCLGIDDLDAIVAVTQPSGTPRGTIFAHQGSGGTEFYVAGVNNFVAAGFRVVQIRWLSDWEQTASKGILAAACRPATVMRWAFDNVHEASRATGFCGIGHSGGTGALSYALAHYGAGDYFDFITLNSGPPFGRIDYGCAAGAYTGPARNLCPGLPDAPMALPADVLDTWENTHSCGTDSPPAADIAKWAADSVVSPGATYDYPSTPISFWDCTNHALPTSAGAYFYSQEITSTRTVSCTNDCMYEALHAAPEAQMEQEMVNSCMPNH